MKQYFSDAICQLLKSYLNSRTFYVKVKDSYSNIQVINAGILQESILSPVLRTLYTADIPATPNTTTCTFADDTGIIAIHKDPQEVVKILESHISSLGRWLVEHRIEGQL